MPISKNDFDRTFERLFKEIFEVDSSALKTTFKTVFDGYERLVDLYNNIITDINKTLTYNFNLDLFKNTSLYKEIGDEKFAISVVKEVFGYFFNYVSKYISDKVFDMAYKKALEIYLDIVFVDYLRSLVDKEVNFNCIFNEDVVIGKNTFAKGDIVNVKFVEKTSKVGTLFLEVRRVVDNKVSNEVLISIDLFEESAMKRLFMGYFNGFSYEKINTDKNGNYDFVEFINTHPFVFSDYTVNYVDDLYYDIVVLSFIYKIGSESNLMKLFSVLYPSEIVKSISSYYNYYFKSGKLQESYIYEEVKGIVVDKIIKGFSSIEGLHTSVNIDFKDFDIKIDPKKFIDISKKYKNNISHAGVLDVGKLKGQLNTDIKTLFDGGFINDGKKFKEIVDVFYSNKIEVKNVSKKFKDIAVEMNFNFNENSFIILVEPKHRKDFCIMVPLNYVSMYNFNNNVNITNTLNSLLDYYNTLYLNSKNDEYKEIVKEISSAISSNNKEKMSSVFNKYRDSSMGYVAGNMGSKKYFSWCTASTSEGYFLNYGGDKGELLIWFRPHYITYATQISRREFNDVLNRASCDWLARFFGYVGYDNYVLDDNFDIDNAKKCLLYHVGYLYTVDNKELYKKDEKIEYDYPLMDVSNIKNNFIKFLLENYDFVLGFLKDVYPIVSKKFIESLKNGGDNIELFVNNEVSFKELFSDPKVKMYEKDGKYYSINSGFLIYLFDNSQKPFHFVNNDVLLPFKEITKEMYDVYKNENNIKIDFTKEKDIKLFSEMLLEYLSKRNYSNYYLKIEDDFGHSFTFVYNDGKIEYYDDNNIFDKLSNMTKEEMIQDIKKYIKLTGDEAEDDYEFIADSIIDYINKNYKKGKKGK